MADDKKHGPYPGNDTTVVSIAYSDLAPKQSSDQKSKKPKGNASGRPTVYSNTSQEAPKIDLVHIEDVASPPQETKRHGKRKQKLKNHCGRFWLCYLVGIIILLAIALPILFLLIVPALAQLLVDKTDLPIYGGTLKAISNDAVVIGLETALSVPAGLRVRLDPFVLYLYNKDTADFSPFTSVALDDQHMSGHTAISVANETVRVENRTELYSWLNETLYGQYSRISAKGRTTAHLGALQADIKLDKTVEIPALWELKGVAIDDATFILPAEEDGTNLAGSFILPNWSELTLGLGNVTLNIWADDLLLGVATLLDVLAVPGNNTIPFRGQVFLDTVVDNIGAVLSSQADMLAEGKIGLRVGGNQTLVDGEHITYLESVLNPARIYTETTITKLLTDGFESFLQGNTTLGAITDLLGSILGGSGGGDGGGGGDDSDSTLDGFIDDGLVKKMQEEIEDRRSNQSDWILTPSLIRGLDLGQ
ncbi:hypothetical protein F4778DRAFT_774074 [Xylariomycetidae sp. FL2044]|nr:hypothetical protein F4778DRAFT_774074 [Xylariomycetidae sp. FL2044]